VQDIKDIQRNDYGYTNLEAANLFTRTLGYHQDLICEAFATGDLSHIKSQEDLIHELESSGGERDLLLRIPNLYLGFFQANGLIRSCMRTPVTSSCV
jgi:hypothetical protein